MTIVVNHRRDKPALGIATFMGNLLLMTILSAFVKLLSETYPLSAILLIRFFSAFLFFSLLVFPRFGISGLHTKRPWEHAIRSFSGVASLSMFFFAISMVPMADATAISYSAPLFITILSIFFLNEKIGPARWSAVIAGFCGVLIIAQPTGATINSGLVAAIGSAIFGAIVAIWLRRLSDTEKSATIGFYYNTTGLSICIAWFLFNDPVYPNPADMGLFLIFALCCAAQQWLLTISFRYAEASLLAPFDYFAMVFAAILGYWVWFEIPTIETIIGGSIIAVSGLVIFFRKRSKATTTMAYGNPP
ncbi:MAG: drug/metabolite transporter (DMT)-like permease [Gammaproteobacteria bacterium]|jgi:drug/metabolite transporter (DMT)-like permease